jgi:hypothetical protein
MLRRKRSRVGDAISGAQLTVRHQARCATLLEQLPRRDRAIQLVEQHQGQPRVASANRSLHAAQLTYFFVEPRRR